MSKEKYLFLCAALTFFTIASTHQAPTGLAQTGTRPVAPTTEASPFQFMIDEITLMSKNRVIARNNFKETGKFRALISGAATAPTAPFVVRFGHLSDTDIVNGALQVSERSLVNLASSASVMTLGQLNVGDPAPRNAVATYGALFSVPMDSNGNATFAAPEMLADMALSVKFHTPNMSGNEKLTVGLTDVEAFRPAATLSVRKDLIRLDRIKPGPAKGYPWSEVTVARAEVREVRDIRSGQITLRVTGGQLTGTVNLVGRDGKQQGYKLAGNRTAGTLDMHREYAASIFVETLPRPGVKQVNVAKFTLSELRRTKAATPIQIDGLGFGPDVQLEVYPDGQEARKARIRQIVVSPGNTRIEAKASLADAPARSYTVRITSGGQTTTLAGAIRVQ